MGCRGDCDSRMMDLSKDPDYFKYGPTDDYKPVLFPMGLSLWTSSTKSSSTSGTGLWNSLQALSSFWPLSSISSSSETKRVNGLHVLPPEVFWNMLDECLFQSGDISLQHEPFHLLLALSQVDHQINERVQQYVTRRLPRHFLRRELGDIEVFPWVEGGNGQQWYPGEASDFPIEVVEDFLGRVIQSDCPACFAYILDYCGVMVSHCNHIGWSFIALAIAFGSSNIIRYILSHPSASHPLAAQLFGPANINFPSPTPLGILARCRNVDRLDEVLNLIERPIAKANVPSSAIVGAFNADDLYWLCTYIAPYQARRLKKLGFCFSRVTDRMAQWYIWHGAVKNSVELLDYLRVTCPLDLTQLTPEQTHTPLRAAIAGDRVDVVHWFAKHDLSRAVEAGSTVKDIAVAMERFSPESADIVKVLLFASGRSVTSVQGGILLRHMLSSLCAEAHRLRETLSDPNYASWHVSSEAITIAKCKYIMVASAANDYTRPDGPKGLPENETQLVNENYTEARQCAFQHGFNDLADWLWPCKRNSIRNF